MRFLIWSELSSFPKSKKTCHQADAVRGLFLLFAVFEVGGSAGSYRVSYFQHLTLSLCSGQQRDQLEFTVPGPRGSATQVFWRTSVDAYWILRCTGKSIEADEIASLRREIGKSLILPGSVSAITYIWLQKKLGGWQVLRAGAGGTEWKVEFDRYGISVWEDEKILEMDVMAVWCEWA